jgi:hypothetical protein
MAVRRRPVVVEFMDRFGENQTIHRDKGGTLKIRRKSPTVVLAMTAAIGRHVGERIREERLKADMTMEQLAAKSGLKGGKQAIYHAETAMDTGVRIGTVYAIAAALNISPFSLLPPVDVVVRESSVRMEQRESLAV